MATLGEYLGVGSGTTKLLLHLNGNSNDSSGNGNSGTDTSITYSQANGRFGQGAGFNGSSSNIQFGGTAPSVFSAKNSWTVSMFINKNTVDTRKSLLETNTSTTAIWQNRGVDIYLNTSNGIQVERGDGSSADSVGSNTTISSNKFYNLIVIYDGTNIYIYIDGMLSNSGVSSRTALTQTIGYLGMDVESGTAMRWYNGSIDEVILENRAWSASEVKKYYTMAKGRFGII